MAEISLLLCFGNFLWRHDGEEPIPTRARAVDAYNALLD